MSSDSFKRHSAFNLMRWISHRYGFGTYIHYINGYLSRDTNRKAGVELKRLIKVSEGIKSNVYVDTMISPSLTSAIAQAIQLPSVSGKDVNMMLFEYPKDQPEKIGDIIENVNLAISADFDILILASSDRNFGIRNNIHLWLTRNDMENGTLMILMSYVIMGHPEWNNAQVNIFAVFPEEHVSKYEQELKDKIKEGRLPISVRNIELITKKDEISLKDIILQKSKDADLTILGFHPEAIKQRGIETFLGLDEIGDVLYVNTREEKKLS